MPSAQPADWGNRGVGGAPVLAGPMRYESFNLGQWTPGAPVQTSFMNIPRGMVVREIWVSCDAVPFDADGTTQIQINARDTTEGASDILVALINLETVVLVANKAYQLTIATETTENQNTLETADVLLASLQSNSGVIDTNPNVLVTVGYQMLDQFSV